MQYLFINIYYYFIQKCRFEKNIYRLDKAVYQTGVY